MKIISKILFITSIIFLISSCNKEKTGTLIEESITPKQLVGGGNGVGKVVNMGSDDCCEDHTTRLDIVAGEWCCNSGTTCAACVTITGEKEGILDGLVMASSTKVGEFFSSDDWEGIFPNLNESGDMLSKLQSGNYSLEKLYDPNISKIIYRAYSVEDYFGLPTILE